MNTNYHNTEFNSEVVCIVFSPTDLKKYKLLKTYQINIRREILHKARRSNVSFSAKSNRNFSDDD